jgi:hypothetical protein
VGRTAFREVQNTMAVGRAARSLAVPPPWATRHGAEIIEVQDEAGDWQEQEPEDSGGAAGSGGGSDRSSRSTWPKAPKGSVGAEARSRQELEEELEQEGIDTTDVTMSRMLEIADHLRAREPRRGRDR